MANGTRCHAQANCPPGHSIPEDPGNPCQFNTGECDDFAGGAVIDTAGRRVGFTCNYATQYQCEPDDPTCQGGTLAITCCSIESTETGTATITATASATSSTTNSTTTTVTSAYTSTNTITNPGTFTATNSQTLTQTQSQTLSTIATETATQPQTQSQTETQTETKTHQEKAQEEQLDMLQGAANQGLTNGAVDCAAAANSLLQDEDEGTKKLARCTDAMAAGTALKAHVEETARRSRRTAPISFTAEESLLQSGHAPLTLAAFEKNYTISGEEFVRQIVASGAPLSVLQDALRKRFSEQKVQELLELAQKIERPKASLGNAIDFGKPQMAAKPKGDNLRDNLRKSLNEKTVSADPGPKFRANSASPNRESSLNALTPLQDPLFSQSREIEAELSLFDVVHRKYRDKTEMLRPGKNLSPGVIPRN